MQTNETNDPRSWTKLKNQWSENFPNLSRFYSTKYGYHHNGLTIADWPNRKRHLVKSYIFDWFILLVLVVLMIIWFVEPPTFYFRLDDPNISYPQVPETIGSAPITIIITLGPILVMAFAQIWIRDLRDFHQSALASLQLFAVTQMICMFIWLLVGGLRPSFLDKCKPDLSQAPSYITPNGVQWYSDKICTGDRNEVIKAKHSLPSDHAASAMAVAVFLIIYLWAKLKIFDNKSHFWKLVLALPIIIVALFISFSRIHDGEHHLSDILIGIVIGWIVAPIVYRLNYCSLFGPDNHIPCRYTWRGKYMTWRGRNIDADRTLPVTNPEKKEEYPSGGHPNSQPGGNNNGMNPIYYPSNEIPMGNPQM